MYMIIVLTSGWIQNAVDTKIMKHIKSYLGITPVVIIHENEDCEPIEN